MAGRISIFQQVVRIMLPVCFIAAGVYGFRYYKSQETRVKKRPPVKSAMLVETVSLKASDHVGRISVMGTVIPDRDVYMKSQVGGKVVFVSPAFVRGGVINQGDVLLKLDDSDYTIEIQKARSTLEKAQSDLAIELGSQKIALEEFKLIQKMSKNKVKATDLALRKPQLAQARAVVKSARADLDKALLNQSRTILKVPFNSLILEKKVDKGSLVNAQESIATLVNVDSFHVEALVPPEQVGALDLHPDTGSTAQITSPYSDRTWQGRVIRTTGKISASSRMAGVLIEVKDPLGLNGSGQPLMLDDHVVVDIQGRLFEQVYPLPRNLLRDEDRVWVNQGGRLVIKKVTVAWKESQTVYISQGLAPGDEIIVTDLSAPVNGMLLQSSKGARDGRAD